jgi:hypothetical protein
MLRKTDTFSVTRQIILSVFLVYALLFQGLARAVTIGNAPISEITGVICSVVSNISDQKGSTDSNNSILHKHCALCSANQNESDYLPFFIFSRTLCASTELCIAKIVFTQWQSPFAKTLHHPPFKSRDPPSKV